MIIDKKLSKNFNSREFDSPDIKGSGINMNIVVIYKLQEMRDIYKNPIRIKSGYRSIAHNKKVGGKYNSEHLKGNAVDIHIKNNNERYTLIRLAIIVGFNRIGIGTNFLHLDISNTKSKEVVWLYS